MRESIRQLRQIRELRRHLMPRDIPQPRGWRVAIRHSPGAWKGSDFYDFLNLPDGAAGTSTIESKTNFLGAVRAGHVDSISRPLHLGRTVMVIETDVIDADERLVARITQSQVVLRPK